jgi:hypothetical protein
MTEKELSLNYAINFFTSDLGNNTHNKFYDSLCDDIIPDDVSVWEPFENHSADDLLALIENLSNYLIEFKSDERVNDD